MINYKKELVKALDKILPTYDEYIVDSSTKTPCITYLELSNVSNEEGDTIRYSSISFRIKLWSRDEDEVDIHSYTNQIDRLLFSLGFKRTAYNEMQVDTIHELIFTYQCRALEIYK